MFVPKQTSGEKENGFDKSQERFDHCAYQTKGQRQKPDKWKEHQSGDRQRPAKNEQDAPHHEHQKSLHRYSFVFTFTFKSKSPQAA
jgi:hypothetical protein